MPVLTRRNFFASCAGTGLAVGFASTPVSAGTAPTLPLLGKLRPRTSLSVEASPLSIGFETLDREMFDPERTYAHLAQLGVKWARCQTGWARTEKTREVYDFAWLDRVVDSLLKIGIQPWFSISYGNQLYTPEAPHESAVGWAPVFSTEARQAWIAYTRAIAAHFRGRVRHWEIWNEPNIPNFWRPAEPTPGDYVDLVQITAPEIRKRVPNAVIIGGALTHMPRMLDYLERCLQLGMGRYIDKLSYHPYRSVPEVNYGREVRAMRNLLKGYGAAIELWQGENGCPSEEGSRGALGHLSWNEEIQAKWLLRRLLTDLKHRIELTSYFHTVDMVNYVTHAGQTGRTNFKGVLRGNTYEPKRSYFAFQNLCALFDAWTKAHELFVHFSNITTGGRDDAPVDISSIQAATFVRSRKPIYVYWYPANLQRGFVPRQLRLLLRNDGLAQLSKPVLVDLSTGDIHKINQATSEEGFWRLDALPLRDHPLLVTDQDLVWTDGERATAFSLEERVQGERARDARGFLASWRSERGRGGA